MAELTTERLLLRELCEDDWQAVHEYGSDPEVVNHLPWGPNTEADTREFVARTIAAQSEEPRVHYTFAIVRKADGQLVGSIGLNVSSVPNREGWIGYALAKRFWGQGYATEAARAVVAFGFGQVGLHRIFATCDPQNVASARVLEKVGMRREGLMRQHMPVRGTWRDSCLYAILEDDLKAP
ncbi:MAG: GNAT family N-acetyltransferase [Planctomycetota bacterium]